MQDLLKDAGYESIIPVTAEKMKKSGDFDASHYRTWLNDAADYHKKSALMRQHFEEIENGDVILVINEQKHGVDSYIGGNVLIEMALAFYLHKPLFILNEIPTSTFQEEILAMQPTVLHGDIKALIDELAKY